MMGVRFDMVASERLELWLFERTKGIGILLQIAFGWWVVLLFLQPVAGLRPLRERTRSWGDEVCYFTLLKNYIYIYIFEHIVVFIILCLYYICCQLSCEGLL